MGESQQLSRFLLHSRQNFPYKPGDLKHRWQCISRQFFSDNTTVKFIVIGFISVVYRNSYGYKPLIYQGNRIWTDIFTVINFYFFLLTVLE